MTLRAFVVGHRPEDRYLAGRTLRSLAAAGIDATFIPAPDRRIFAPPDSLPTLLVRAGAWLGDATPIRFPERSSTGRPTCAFGRLLGPAGEELDRWKAALSQSGGDFNRTLDAAPTWPSPVSLYFDAVAAAALSSTGSNAPISFAELAALGLRVVHFPRLDVHHTPSLRVMQVITALHRGGAERLTLDLSEFLPSLGVHTRMATVGRAFRSTFPTPPGTIERPDPSQLRAFAIRNGFDLFHAHLLNHDTIKALSTDHFPLLVTLHNARAGWPAGMEQLALPDASLVAACSRAVESEAAAAGIVVPLRTAWNGIRLPAMARTPEIQLQGQNLRRSWGFTPDDIVLLALANPRPQKRLHLLPAILEALQSAVNPDGGARSVVPPFPAPTERRPPSPSSGSQHANCESWHLPADRARFRLVLAGEATLSPSNPTSDEPDFLESDFRKREIQEDVRQLGFVENTAALIVACDVLVSPSAYEGLSLAQLECLALGRPVVATSVGGAPEVAAMHPALRLVPVDATPEAFAVAILDALSGMPRGTDLAPPAISDGASRRNCPPDGSRTPHLLAPFSTESMAARYHWLYRRVLATARLTKGTLLDQPLVTPAPNPAAIAPTSERNSCPPAAINPSPRPRLWLITNNFSTGGAQSSARRLLLELHARGCDVRAAVVQEDPSHPTPGRRALLHSGIPVVSVPPPSPGSPEAAVEDLLHHLDAHPPSAVFFWNLIPVYKILLADALFATPVYDVSPGEMLFESLDRYFASPLPHLPYRTARDYATRLAGVVVKYSRELEHARQTFGVPVQVIPNGIAVQDYVPKPTLPALEPAAPLVFGTSARIHPHKRLEDLIDALKLAHPHLPAWHLRIAGGIETGFESCAESLRQRSAGLPIEWLGDVPDIRSFLSSLDLFLMISEPAGCPNAILEAMASALPVIATDVGGASDLIAPNDSGRLVPPRDARSFANAIVELARDPDLRWKLGQAARQRVATHFTVRQMADRYLALIPGPTIQGTGPT